MTTTTEATNNQVQPPAAVTPAATGTSTAWQSDPIARDIHTALTLGWSLVELRSRVQLAALDDQKLPVAAKAEVSGAALQTADPMQLVKAPNDRLLRASRMRTVFNSIVALQRARFPNSVTIGTLYDPPDQEEVPYLYPDAPDYANIGIKPLADEQGQPLDSDFRLFEVTRRAINCITLLLVDPYESLVPDLVASHQRRLTEAILETATAELSKSLAKGGAAGELEALGVSGVPAAPAASVAPSLTAIAVQSYEYYGNTAPGSALEALPAAETSADLAKGSASMEKPREGDKKAAPPTDLAKAITTISFLTIRLLQAWDGYLRERFTAEGVGTNNLLALMAYEAGRNMASISWNVSVNAITLENQAMAAIENKEAANEAAAGGLYEVFRETFASSSAHQVLHQISALSAVFDEVYYTRTRARPAALTTSSAADDLLIPPDPALPSQVLQAVKQSIEYWQRAVLWLGAMPKPTKSGDGTESVEEKPPKDALAVEDWIRLRQALIEQCGIWFNLMTGQQDLRGFTVGRVTHQILDLALSDLRDLAQRDLPAAAKEVAGQVSNVVDTAVDLVTDISRVATQSAKAGIQRVFGTVNPLLWVIVILGGVVGLALLVVYLTSADNPVETLVALLTSLGTSVLGLLGLRRGNDVKAESEQDVETKIEDEKKAGTEKINEKKEDLDSTLTNVGSGLAGAVSGALGQAGQFLFSAYERGLDRIQIELQSLNYSISVTHPLVMFFIRHRDVEVVRSDLDFLTKVIWDEESRKEQLKNVVTAAFGPMSILLGSPSAAGDEDANAGGDAATTR
jgi:hypothetical protein